MSVDVKNLRRVAGTSAAVITVLQAATAVVAVRRGRRDYADGVWGPGLAAIALTSAAAGRGDRWRRWALAGATAAWATRLEWQMIGRLRHSDEDVLDTGLWGWSRTPTTSGTQWSGTGHGLPRRHRHPARGRYRRLSP